MDESSHPPRRLEVELKERRQSIEKEMEKLDVFAALANKLQ